MCAAKVVGIVDAEYENIQSLSLDEAANYLNESFGIDIETALSVLHGMGWD